MFAYRYFPLDRENRFRGVEIIEARHDHEAMVQAGALRAKTGVPGFELWQGARPVLQQLADPKLA